MLILRLYGFFGLGFWARLDVDTTFFFYIQIFQCLHGHLHLPRLEERWTSMPANSICFLRPFPRPFGTLPSSKLLLATDKWLKSRRASLARLGIFLDRTHRSSREIHSLNVLSYAKRGCAGPRHDSERRPGGGVYDYVSNSWQWFLIALASLGAISLN
jgi:hypothetical protein